MSFLTSYGYCESAESDTEFDAISARNSFDKLSIILSAPTSARISPQQNAARLTAHQILDISTDICEDLGRRNLGGKCSVNESYT